MRSAIACSVFLLLLSVCLYGAGLDDEMVLAEWDGGAVTAGEYIHWWERLDPENRPDLTTDESRMDFLSNMVNAMIMLQVAAERGEDRHPNVTDWAHSRRVNALRERLYQEATKGRLEVDEAEVTEIYEKRLTQVDASHIVCPTYQEALSIVDSLEAGVPFEGLALRHSTCSSGARGGSLGPVRWGDFTDRWSAQAFALKPGEVSQPFGVEDGYAIIKVHDKTVLEPEDSQTEKQRIRANLMKKSNFAEREAFLDSLRIAYVVDVDIGAVVDLCARYAQEIRDRGITSEVVSENIELPLTEKEESLPVAGFKGRTFDYREIIDMILSQPYVVRPKLDDPDEMFNFINRQLNDSLLVWEAEKRGIDKIPEIANQLEKATQNRIITRLYRVLAVDLEIPEDTLRAFYDTHRDSYVSAPGHVASKIVVESKETADSLLVMIKGGASFENLAHERSIDPFTAPEGGNMGFYPVGKDPEFDEFFAQMEVGDMDVFRSVEGHVVLWLRERHQRRPLSFEDARPAVARDASRRFKAMYMDNWIAEKRRELGVTIYEDRLDPLSLPM